MIAEDRRPWPQQLADRDSWSDHVRELAYQVWFMRAGGNAAECHRILKAGGYSDDPDSPGEPVDVPYRTVAYWAQAGKWHERASRDRRSIAIGSEEVILANLGFGFSAGVSWLRRVAEGTEPVRRERDRLDAVRLLADLSGWVGPDRRHAGQRSGLAGGEAVAVDYGSLTDAELLAMERGQLPTPRAATSPDDTDIVDI